MNNAPTRPSLYDRILPAGATGALAAVATVALSIPLRSPDDLLANTASVATVSAIGAVALGIIWATLDRGQADSRQQARRFAAINAALYVATVAATLVTESVAELSNLLSFTWPLAAVMLAGTTIGAPLFQTYAPIKVMRFATPILILAVVAIGVALTLNEVGFNEPPSLSLPPPP